MLLVSKLFGDLSAFPILKLIMNKWFATLKKMDKYWATAAHLNCYYQKPVRAGAKLTPRSEKSKNGIMLNILIFSQFSLNSYAN